MEPPIWTGGAVAVVVSVHGVAGLGELDGACASSGMFKRDIVFYSCTKIFNCETTCMHIILHDVLTTCNIVP